VDVRGSKIGPHWKGSCGQLRDYPTVLRCDYGPELARAAMADWAGVGLHFIQPGEPWRPTSSRSTVESAMSA
jgi:hypothetical protein